MNKVVFIAAAVAAIALPTSSAGAQSNEITIGISISTTGPAAALGVPERNALEFVPKEIAGVPLKIIVLDDGGDPTNATTNARRFVTESKADIIVGSSTTPPTIALANVASEAGIPHIGLAPFPMTRNARNGRWRCRNRYRSWARCSTSTWRRITSKLSAISATPIPTATCGLTTSSVRACRWG